MPVGLFHLLLLLCTMQWCCAVNPAAIQAPSCLRVEHSQAMGGRRVVAVDTVQPRLWWALPESETRGLKQHAYQIIVTSRDPPDNLDNTIETKYTHVLWDSDIIVSDRTEGVYMGEPKGSFLPDTALAVSVRWWPSNAPTTPSPWSEAFNFSTGLIGEAGWGDSQWLDASTHTTHRREEMAGVQMRSTFHVGSGGLFDSYGLRRGSNRTLLLLHE